MDCPATTKEPVINTTVPPVPLLKWNVLQVSLHTGGVVDSGPPLWPETGTLPADSEKRIQAFKIGCLRKLLRISYSEHKTNNWVRSKISLVGPQEPLLAAVKGQKLAWFWHVACHSSFSKTMLRVTFEGGRRHGRQRKYWIDNIRERTSLPMPDLLTRASCRKDWKKICAELSLMSP